MSRWKTRDGREIAVEDMDDDHLLNCLNQIRRWGRFNYAVFDEAAKRGLWKADRGVLARFQLRACLAGQTFSRHGTTEGL